MKFYAACLASYNNGVLHGRWIDATADAVGMQEKVDAMLRASPFPNVTVVCPECQGAGKPWGFGDSVCEVCDGAKELPSAEEWAVHDYDGLANMGEHPSIQAIADYAEFIEEQDDEDVARAVLDECNGDVDDAREMMDNFCGVYGSFRDYADEAADEMMPADAPEMLTRYFDYESFARDLQHDMTVLDVPDGVAVFHA